VAGEVPASSSDDAVSESTSPRPSPAEHDDGTRWLALVLAEMLRTGLALLAEQYPEARGKGKCPKCGWRH
jgi:hypothetical protein